MLGPVPKVSKFTFEKEFESLTNYDDILKKYIEMKKVTNPTPFVYACLFKSLSDEPRLKTLFNHCIKNNVISNKSIQAFLNSYLPVAIDKPFDSIYNRLIDTQYRFTLDTWKLLLIPFTRTRTKEQIESIHKRMALIPNWDSWSFVSLIFAHYRIGNYRAVVRLFEQIKGKEARHVCLHDVAVSMSKLNHTKRDLIQVTRIVTTQWDEIQANVNTWWTKNGWIEGIALTLPTRRKQMQRAGVASILETIVELKDETSLLLWNQFCVEQKKYSDAFLYVLSQCISATSRILPSSHVSPLLEKYKTVRHDIIVKTNRENNMPYSVIEMEDALIDNDPIVRDIRKWNVPGVPRKEISAIAYAYAKEHDTESLKRLWKKEVAPLVTFLTARVVHSVRLDIMNAKQQLQQKLDYTETNSGKDERKGLKEDMTFLNKQLKKGVPLVVGEEGVVGIIYTSLVEGWKFGDTIKKSKVLELEQTMEELHELERDFIESRFTVKNDKILLKESDSE